MCFHLLVIYGHIKIFGNLSCLLTCMPCTWTLSLHFTASCNMEILPYLCSELQKIFISGFFIVFLGFSCLSFYYMLSWKSETHVLNLVTVHSNSCIIIISFSMGIVALVVFLLLAIVQLNWIKNIVVNYTNNFSEYEYHYCYYPFLFLSVSFPPSLTNCLGGIT